MRAARTAFLVGAFTVGGLLLGAGLLVAAGELDPFEDHVTVAVCFDESVSGLETGSAVKLRGARIGTVSSLRVVWDGEEGGIAVVAMCELRDDAIGDRLGPPLDLSLPSTLPALVETGLRATLGIEGITALRFVSLDFYDPAEHPPDVPGWAEAIDAVVVPSVASPIAEIAESIPHLVEELGKAEIAGATADLRALLQTLHRQVREVDLGALAASAEQAVTSLGRAVDQGQHVLALLRVLVDPHRGLGAEAARALERVASAAGAVGRLAEYLERNPGALVAGRPVPEAGARR